MRMDLQRCLGGRGEIRAATWRLGLREVGEALGKEWRGGLVIHPGTAIQRLDHQIWSFPVDRLLV